MSLKFPSRIEIEHKFNKLMSVFHASAQLLIMNFVITLSK